MLIFDVLFLFVVFSLAAMMCGAEIAVGTVSRDSLEKLQEMKIHGAGHLISITRNRRRYHFTFLCGRVLLSTGVFIAGLVVIERIAAETVLDPALVAPLTVILVIVLLVVAEGLLARIIAIGEYENTVPRFSTFLTVFFWILYPLNILLDAILGRIIRESDELAAKEDALMEFVKSESEAGVIEREEKDMIEGVLDFFDTTVREVMVPRIDVVAIDKTTSVEELITLFKEKGHSRIPVYDGRIDNIIGVIYAKDILPIIAANGKNNLSITDTLRNAYYVHETKKCSVLLKELKKNKVHIAVVVDEYGGTAGIVALEDLLEEIVGDIQDEYDREDRDYIWINNKTVLMVAGIDIDDLNEVIHTDIPRDDFDTLAGFIYHQLGVIPEGGEEFTWKNVTFSIKELEGNRISKVLIKLDEPLVRRNDEDETV